MIQHDDLNDANRIAVPSAYQELFTHFYYAHNRSNGRKVKTLLPSYQTILIFNFGPPAVLDTQQGTQIAVDKCLVLGTIRKSFDYALPPQSKILVVNFKDDAFYRFFGTTIMAETGPLHPDGLLTENCFTALWHQLDRMGHPQQQVAYILDFCRPYLKRSDPIAAQLRNLKDQPIDPIKTVAHSNKLTVRNIQLKQKKYYGYSEKEYHRYQRFIKAIAYMEKHSSKELKEDWFSIVSHCGYYDQSQLIKDFKHYLNLTPTAYLKFQREICNPLN